MSLPFFLILLGIMLAAFLAFLIWFLKSTTAKIDDLKRTQSQNEALNLMQQQIGQLTTNMNAQLQSMSSQFQKTTGSIGTVLGGFKEDMGQMKETTREVLEKAKDISNLENLLRAPKFRGGIGELFLGDLLAQILPPAHYSLQHKFKSGEAVDAIVKIGANIVPIDAKFPLENFKKYVTEEETKSKENFRKLFITDVKKHIDAIADKYILPDEGTYAFALMYVPAENIYYETILKDESLTDERGLFSYAQQKRVIPVSPNTFFAYLQVIVLGLKGLQIEKSARTIFQSLTRLQGDLDRFKKDFQVLGSHLVNAKSKFDEADKRLDKFSDKLELAGEEGRDRLPAPKKKKKSP